MTANRTKLLLPSEMARAGWAVLDGRDDIEAVSFSPDTSEAELHAELATAAGIALWGRPFRAVDVVASPHLQAVARIGVGYDAVDVAALSAAGIPLLTAGIANSLSVAEQALFFMFHLAKAGAVMDAVVKGGRWGDKYATKLYDLAGRKLLIIGFGRIGTRLAARCLALEMIVFVHDPYVAQDAISARGCIPVPDLELALPAIDVVSIHCPKSPTSIGMFNAARLKLMQPHAWLINTARGGIVDEAALHAALVEGRLAGAGLDVFLDEPTSAENPLLRLPNVIAAPHMAGVTQEALDRMAVASVRNLLSVIDGHPNLDNVINKDVL
jgi:D-3-phosphoglycerate dehydrogenase